MPTLRRLAELWDDLAPREQLLALAVAGLSALLLLTFCVQRARATLDTLDREIDRLSSDLVNLHYQVARRQNVEARYDAVANQHSSDWSESEIRDRLRQEIYRLANRVPPGLDENGIPRSTNNESGALVSIPTLGQGQLTEGGDGFREYQLSVHIPSAPVENMLAYLERLQGSPQSLRLDRIDLRRAPSGSDVSADIDITRIVVDTPSTESAPGTPGLPARETQIALAPADWTLESATALEAQGELLIRGDNTTARAWMERSLPAGATYDLSVEGETAGKATLTIAIDGTPLNGANAVALNGESGPLNINLRFTTPDTGGRVPVQLAYLQLETSDTTVRIRRLVITPVRLP